MDYCDQCRRHLNGALTCAGCGRSAEELRWTPSPARDSRPAAPQERGVGAAGANGTYGPDDSASRQHADEVPARPAGADPSRRDGYAQTAGDPYRPAQADRTTYADRAGRADYGDPADHRDHADHPDQADHPVHSDHADSPDSPDHAEYPGPDGEGRPGDTAPGPDGPGRTDHRAARRRRPAPRRARSKRGRRVLIGVLGVVLAAGALSLAQLALDPGGGTGGGGSGVSDDSTGLDYDGDPGATGRPAVPGSPVNDTGTGGRPGGATTGTAGADPSASDGTGSPDPSGSQSADASTAGASPGDGATAGGTGGTSPTGGPVTGPGDPSEPGSTGPGAPPATTPAAPPPPDDPTPSPTHSHCRPILIWCA